MEQYINHQARASDFISLVKEWNINTLQGIVSNYLIHNIKSFPTPICNMKDKLICCRIS